MGKYQIKIQAFGENAIQIEWPLPLHQNMLDELVSFSNLIKENNYSNWETIPIYNSLTLISPVKIDFELQEQRLIALYTHFEQNKQPIEKSLWELPVCYDLEFGLDLSETADTLGVKIEELIKEHCSHQYIIYGIGFLPGFMYLGGVPEILQIPRRKDPRMKVAKGSIGLAGKQTGMYPQDSPGGWNIIGRSPVSMFNPSLEKPCFVSIGDQVQFKSIDRAEYELILIQQEVGVYQPNKTTLRA